MNTKKLLVGLAVAAVVGVTTRTLAAAPQADPVEHTVTEKGFEPARVEVTQGQPVKLIVTRITENTCAKEIGIPDAHINAKLPLNQPVTVTFTPTQSGDIKYACAMNMVRGVIHVASSDDAGQPSRSQSGPTTGQGGITGGQGGMMGGGMMGGQNGMMGGGMQDMRTIHGLLSQHDKIKRSVKDIPNGVESVTTSDDPQVAHLIREHVGEMKSRIEEGRPIHQMDPLFREIFANYQHIHKQIADVPGGVRVTETADTANVVPLVRQHARRAVSEFVAQGMPRMMQPTPLPEGYTPTQPQNRAAKSHHGCRCMGRS